MESDFLQPLFSDLRLMRDAQDGKTITHCLHPIYRLITKTDSTIVKRLPSGFQVLRVDNSGYRSAVDKIGKGYQYYKSDKRIFVDDLSKPSVYAIELPCGKCVMCLKSLVNKWSFRLCVDIKHSSCNAFFVTLTYSPDKRCTKIEDISHTTGEIKAYDLDELLMRKRVQRYKTVDKRLFNEEEYPFDVPDRYFVSDDNFHINLTGLSDVCISLGNPESARHSVSIVSSPETKHIMTYECEHGFLNYPDLELFFKRTRRMLEYYYGIDTFKYFCCGEYSPAPHLVNGKMTEGFLPHYHLLIWYKDTLRSRCGWHKPKPKRGSNKMSAYLPLLVKLPNGSVYVPPLTVDVLRHFLYRAWGKCEFGAFNFSPVRSVEACTRYISKYILKGKLNVKYYNDAQSLRPFDRWMSQGIGKSYAQSIASMICSSCEFGFSDGAYFRFYPSQMLKWSYSHFVKDEFDDDDREFSPYYFVNNYFEMMRKRETFIRRIEKPLTEKALQSAQNTINLMLASVSKDCQ